MHGNLSVCPAVPVGEMQQLPKRKRSKSPVVTVVRGNPPAEVLPVRIPYTRFDVAHSQPSAPIAFKPFTPYPPAQTHAQAQTQPSQPAFATGEFDAGSDAEPPQDERRPSRHQKEREQQDDQWRMQIPELAFRRICQQAAEPQRRQKLADSLRNEFEARANVAMMQCSQCHSVDCLQRLSPAPAITFVTLQGHISVSAPTHFCTRTGHQYTVHPFSMDCFHATPSRPEIWYDNELLVTTSAAQLSGPTAIQAHCATLQQLHLYNGFDAEKPAIWQNLSSAAAQWRRVEVSPTHVSWTEPQVHVSSLYSYCLIMLIVVTTICLVCSVPQTNRDLAHVCLIDASLNSSPVCMVCADACLCMCMHVIRRCMSVKSCIFAYVSHFVAYLEC